MATKFQSCWFSLRIIYKPRALCSLSPEKEQGLEHHVQQSAKAVSLVSVTACFPVSRWLLCLQLNWWDAWVCLLLPFPLPMPVALAGRVLCPQGCPGRWAQLAHRHSCSGPCAQLVHPFIKMTAAPVSCCLAAVSRAVPSCACCSSSHDCWFWTCTAMQKGS